MSSEVGLGFCRGESVGRVAFVGDFVRKVCAIDI